MSGARLLSSEAGREVGGGGGAGQRRPEWLRQTVDVHGADGPAVVGVVAVAGVDGDAVSAAPGGRVIQRVSALRLLASWPRPLVPDISWPRLTRRMRSRGRGQSHGRQTGAGARVISFIIINITGKYYF